MKHQFILFLMFFVPLVSAELNAGGLMYSTYIGETIDSGTTYGYPGVHIEVDATGNAYIMGYTASTSYPFTSGAYDMSFNGATDMVISKLNADGTSLVFSTYLGGSDYDCDGTYGELGDMTIDSTGNIYVTGHTWSSDFPTVHGGLNTSYTWHDGFAAKISADGSTLLYSTFLGSDTMPQDITVDAGGNVYICGRTNGTDFPTTPGAYDTLNSGTDGFVIKLNTDASKPVFSTFLGDDRGGRSISLDKSGNVYVASGGGIKVKKLSPDGSSMVYSSTFSTFMWDYNKSIAVTDAGNAVILGVTDDFSLPVTPGAFDTTWDSCNEYYVAQISADGSSLVYCTFLGGYDSIGYGGSLVLDPDGNACITGCTPVNDFPVTSGAYDLTYNGGKDIIVSVLSADGSSCLYSTYLGGAGDEYGHGIAVDPDGYLYVAGTTLSADYPTTPGAFNTVYSGAQNIVVTKLEYESSMVVPQISGGTIIMSIIVFGGILFIWFHTHRHLF